MVRGQPQPCRLAGLGRHGRGADDDLAVRALADLDLRLAHRHARPSASSPGRCCCRPRCWCAGRPSRRGRQRIRACAADGAGMSVAQALRSPQFLVLGLTFFACCAAHSGPIFHMVSYAMLCGVAPMAAVSIYSVEGLAGLGGRLLLGRARRPVRRQAGADRGPPGAGARDRDLYLRQPARRVLRARRHLRHGLRRRDAALCGAGARVFRPAHHGHGVRRGDDAVEHRHGARPAGRRLDVRHLRHLHLAVHRLVRRRRSARWRWRSPSRRCRASDCSRREHRYLGVALFLALVAST